MTDRKPYQELGRAGQTRRMRAVARAALAAYDIVPARLTRLARGFNTTFRVDTADGRRHALRVHRPDNGPTTAMIRAELTWLSALRKDTELVVPEPLVARDGDLLTVVALPEPRTCDLLRWVEGRFIDEQLTPARLWLVGGLMARLQLHATTFAAPAGFHRGPVDHVTQFGRTQADSLSPEVIARAAELVAEVHSTPGGPIVRTALERARAARDELGRGSEVFGLIHADLHQENYLFHGAQVNAIDFDDCGHGPFVYDLAVTLSELRHRNDYATLRAALLDGYRAVRPLADEHEALIDAFIGLREVQLMMWFLEERADPLFANRWATTVTWHLRRLVDG